MTSSEQMKQLTLVFLRRDGEVLLAMKKRGFGAGRWNGVGGKLELGETVEEALLRETREEIGVRLTSYEKVAQIRFQEIFKGEPTIMNVSVYTAHEWSGEPIETEEMRPEWFKLDQVPYADMWPDDEYWLPLVLSGQKLRAEFELDANDHIKSHDIRVVKKV